MKAGNSAGSVDGEEYWEAVTGNERELGQGGAGCTVQE